MTEDEPTDTLTGVDVLTHRTSLTITYEESARLDAIKRTLKIRTKRGVIAYLILLYENTADPLEKKIYLGHVGVERFTRAEWATPLSPETMANEMKKKKNRAEAIRDIRELTESDLPEDMTELGIDEIKLPEEEKEKKKKDGA